MVGESGFEPPTPGPELKEAEDDVLRNRRDEGKIVLPCRPKFPQRDKSFFQGHFAVASISVQAIRWTPI
jgi:hypothetical protein